MTLHKRSTLYTLLIIPHKRKICCLEYILYVKVNNLKFMLHFYKALLSTITTKLMRFVNVLNNLLFPKCVVCREVSPPGESIFITPY